MNKEIMANALATEGRGVKVFFAEFVNVDYLFGYIGRIIYGESGLQNIYILENSFWGKMLFINNHLQFTSRDEFIYHEALVHIPIQATPEFSVKKVLICGGGDYGASREVLKYPQIEEVYIVDIDPKIPKLIEEYFPEMLPENPKDSRLKLIVADAFERAKKFLEEGKIFDLVIIDSTDPDIGEITQELSHALFSEEFHNILKIICPKGVIVQQCGTPFTMKNILQETYKLYTKVYPKEEIFCYRAGVPSFGGDTAYIMRCPLVNPQIPKWKELEETKYYTHEIHRASFILPKFWKEALER
ncbi:MAG: spermine synthase [Thermodesulfobacteriaceae bacterium]|nr:spermine synthase [Thermodesulfobacteriaceae bacterium]MCX8042347.1 spermine synthase [Thermodesulfobacteriaceae bacterium]MDW8136677.1 spermine synthase [Thermodesulfobacterium sp.]